MFRHPGYPEPNNCFLSLPQTDSKIHEASGQIVRGVHHKTALIACGILTGNAYCATYFALTRNAVAGVYVCLEDLLVEKEYYFIIPGAPRYSIVASFRDWKFPHQALDNLWPHDPAFRDDRRCNITGDWGNPVQIVPRTERRWCRLNKMTFGPKPRGPGDNESSLCPNSMASNANKMYLEPSLHAPFRAGSFAFVPKLTPMGMEYVLTIFSKYAGDPEESWIIFNGRPARPFAAGSKQLLFARFAWTIFLHSNPWMNDGIGPLRTVLRLYVSANTRDWDLNLIFGKHRAPDMPAN
ncbi:hypothetical protein HDV63DRAFT_369363 [Trichoderma sp. SZMC 28014]